MGENKLISIVIPLYNKGKAIERGLKSILSQTYPYWECEIVDDGSTDDSAAYAKKYTYDKRMHYHYKSNGGVSSARNYGVAKANGDYIIFLDADDVFMPKAFEILIATLEKYHTDVAVGNYIVGGKRKFNLPCSTKYSTGVLHNNFYSWYADLVVPRTGAAIFKKEVLQNHPYKEYLSRYEDAEQLFSIMRENRIAYTPQLVMIYALDMLGLSKAINPNKDFSTQVNFEGKTFWERMLLASLLNGAIAVYLDDNLQERYSQWVRYIVAHRILAKLFNTRRKYIRIMQRISILNTRKELNKLYSKLLGGGKRSSAVKKNIIGSFAVRGISIVISLMLVPMTLGYVSSELYGIWLTLSSIVMWLGFFDVGFTLGLKNKLTEAIALNDWERGKALVSTTYFTMVLIFLPLCAVLMIVIPFVNWSSFLNVSQRYNMEIQKAMYVLAACFCLQMIANVLTSIVSAFQKVALASAFPVIGNAVSLLVIFLLTKFAPPSLVALACAISVMPVLVIGIASVILFGSAFNRVSPNIHTVNLSYVKDIFSLGAKFFIIQIQVVVLFQATNILISNVSGPNEVTSYNIAYKYMAVAMMIYNIILSPLWPAFTDAYTKKDFDWMKRIYSKIVKVYMLSVVVIVLMVIVSPLVYRLWIGNTELVPMLMTIAVAVYIAVNSWDSLQVFIINGIGAVKLQTYVTLVGLIAHIPLSLALGNYIGVYGVVASMIIINVFYSCVFTAQTHKLLSQKATGIWIK